MVGVHSTWWKEAENDFQQAQLCGKLKACDQQINNKSGVWRFMTSKAARSHVPCDRLSVDLLDVHTARVLPKSNIWGV